jgi:hypothetical protein
MDLKNNYNEIKYNPIPFRILHSNGKKGKKRKTRTYHGGAPGRKGAPGWAPHVDARWGGPWAVGRVGRPVGRGGGLPQGGGPAQGERSARWWRGGGRGAGRGGARLWRRGAGRGGCAPHGSRRCMTAAAPRVLRRREKEKAPRGRATAARSTRDEHCERGGHRGAEGWWGGAPPGSRAAAEIWGRGWRR